MTRTARGRRSNDGATKRARANLRPTETSRAKGVSSSRERSKSAWQMFLHDRSVRSRVAALVLLPLLGTLVLGTMFFRNALDDATTASRVESLAEVGLTAVSALDALQDERDVTGLADNGGTGPGAVGEARTATDTALAALSDAVDERRDDDLGAGFNGAVISFDREMERLAGYREQRDLKNPPFSQGGTSGYHRFAEALQRLVTASGAVNDDPQLARRISAMADIAQAVESASLERGVVAFSITQGAVTGANDRDLAVVLAGEQDMLLEGRFISGLGFTEQARIYSNQIFVSARAVADTRSDIRNGARVRATPTEWYEASTTRLDSLRDIEHESAERVVTQAAEATDNARITAILSAAAVVAVLALTIYLAIVVARSIIGPLRRLRASALETAQTQLPALVDRVHKDGPAAARDVPDAVSAEGRDEIGQVATAFNDVHSTAVKVAAEQALLRQNLDTIVVNLSRRTQSLVDRQLGEIEGLEQRERDPDQLSTLFRIDHMATRVRRHAESLLVLAGVEEMRKQSSAAGVLDVVRTAVGEVEQYPRVKFGVMPTDLITAGAVDDIAHLLAELIDNATEFSAPATPVRVTSQPLLGGGLRLQVTDSGLGIPAGQLEELNERLHNVGDIDVAASRTLGLYVVARLAAKHGIQVRLEAVPEGGTAAQVDLPAHLILSPLDTNEGVLSAVTPETVVPTPSAPSDGWGVDSDPSPFRRDDSSPSVPVTASGLPRRGDDAGETRIPIDTGETRFPSVMGESRSPSDTGESPFRPDSGESRLPADLGETRFPSDTGESRFDTAERRFRSEPAAPAADADRPTWPAPEESRLAPSVPADAGSPADSDGWADSGSWADSGDRVDTGDRTDEAWRPPPTPTPAPPPAPAAPTTPARSSLRAPEPTLPESDSPIYDSVASAWFSRSSSTAASDWSSPADEGWRRAAEALRSAEEAASARRQRDTEPIQGPAQVGSGWANRDVTPAASATPAAPAPQVEEEPVLSASGLPLRRRGASLVPGSIGDAAGIDRPERPAAAGKDASTVASTLANLQRGVGRGREETGGWVPKRPSDPERSNS
ncbi:sensor histidine kinase [Jiangella asiatica]|uniref:histidine kinase n=1 Tax=Jiangella asiatica TaxID=2530372 RepID=A0A4R5CL94_9ACTN|nr:sensor histidine kinase [Jiangella asiatica]TDD98242.1 sensor histidine kinase [Jiangella asiatica]